MFGRIRARGLSLLEIVISTSLLAGTFMLFSTIFGVALRGTASAGEISEAIAEANFQLVRLETMAKQNNWSSLLAANGERFESHGFHVEISLRESPLYSTSTSTELAFSASSQARTIDSVVTQAEVRVEKEGVAIKQVRLLSRPRRKLDDPPIVFRQLPSTSLGRDESVTITAHLIAEDGSEISTLFKFQVIPLTGNGTLNRSRNAREATFTNATRGRGGSLLYTGGTCRLKARTSYFGQAISQDSPELELLP